MEACYVIDVGLIRSGLTIKFTKQVSQCLSTPGLSLCPYCGFLSACQLSLLEPWSLLETSIISSSLKPSQGLLIDAFTLLQASFKLLGLALLQLSTIASGGAQLKRQQSRRHPCCGYGTHGQSALRLGPV